MRLAVSWCHEEAIGMIEAVASKQAEIEALCEEYGVRRLALFGSATKGTWREGTSDLDFLVDIGDYDDRVGRRFMGFLAGLERLFGDNFDVVSEGGVKSEGFRAELDRTAVTLCVDPEGLRPSRPSVGARDEPRPFAGRGYRAV